MKLVSWQSVLTDHQLHTWKALQALVNDQILFVLGRVDDDIRTQQGWKGVNLNGLNVEILPTQNWWKYGKTIIQQNSDSIHVFGGFWADRRFFPLLLYAVWRGVKTAVMNEAYSETSSGYLNEEPRLISQAKVLLRPKLYRIAALILNLVSKRNRPCMLVIGARAVQQFLLAGFKPEQVFPFGYFVPKQVGIKPTQKKHSSQLRLIFVGSLLKIKGLDVAIEAINTVNNQQEGPKVSLDIYGQGNPDSWLTSNSTGIAYKGIIPFGTAQAVIAQYDFLILPSRHDGWGVVVNESLLQGVPVIISDHVGAKTLVDATGAGITFRSGDSKDLERVLKDLVTNQTLQHKLRDHAASVENKILPERAAKYMIDIFDCFFFGSGERPNALWNDEEKNQS